MCLKVRGHAEIVNEQVQISLAGIFAGSNKKRNIFEVYKNINGNATRPDITVQRGSLAQVVCKVRSGMDRINLQSMFGILEWS